MAIPLITKEHLQNRLGPALFTRVFNDYNHGEPNDEADKQLREEASSKVRGALGNVYSTDLLTPESAYADELRRITLDVAHAMCAMRQPEIVRLDGFAMMKQAETELEKLRNGLISLSSDPEDPAPDGGSGPGGASSECTSEECIQERRLPGLGTFYG